MITEIQLWDYLDGALPEAERLSVERALASDEGLRQTLLSMRQLHETLQSIAPEQPSMRFTQNVMDAIAHEAAVFRPQPLLSGKFLRGIALGIFALLGLTALLGLLFPQNGKPVQLPLGDQAVVATQWFDTYLSLFQNPAFLSAGAVVAAVGLLYFADNWMAQQRQQRVSQ